MINFSPQSAWIIAVCCIEQDLTYCLIQKFKFLSQLNATYRIHTLLDLFRAASIGCIFPRLVAVFFFSKAGQSAVRVPTNHIWSNSNVLATRRCKDARGCEWLYLPILDGLIDSYTFISFLCFLNYLLYLVKPSEIEYQNGGKFITFCLLNFNMWY